MGSCSVESLAPAGGADVEVDYETSTQQQQQQQTIKKIVLFVPITSIHVIDNWM